MRKSKDFYPISFLPLRIQPTKMVGKRSAKRKDTMNALRLLVVILILPYLCTGFTVARLGFDPLQSSSYLSMNASEKKLPSRKKLGVPSPFKDEIGAQPPLGFFDVRV